MRGSTASGRTLPSSRPSTSSPPLTNDPFLYGQIAAANSLSDIYAMAARPVSALNIVCFPDDQLPLEILHEILRGGAEKAREAGAAILGGHSVRDTEIKYGLAVTGVLDPANLITNEKAQPGDALLLTKPVGTGAMTAAYQKDRIATDLWNACCALMTRLNRAASEAMLLAGAHAATDITGYGLLGHAAELAEASGVALEIEARSVPLIDGSLDLYRRGFVTRACATNRDWLADRLEAAADIPEPLLKLLMDAQTSGGLLIAMPEAQVPAFESAMRAAGQVDACHRIGSVRAHEEGRPRVTLG
jgi:selenide, water dikinase